MTKTSNKKDHGGNVDDALRTYGGDRGDWLDLSTGINPEPYPVGRISSPAWAELPSETTLASLKRAARSAYGTDADVIPFHGAQGAIQAMPHLAEARRACILTPTYNEHRAALMTAGWRVEDVTGLGALCGADMAVVVNPNNPDGQRHDPRSLIGLAGKVGLLVVDESFVETDQALSLAPDVPSNVVVIRSFGKFYGLAGVRLGFALAHGRFAARLADLAGPWPVSGPAIEIARRAFDDTAWRADTRKRLAGDAKRLDALADSAGWDLVGGTSLFRTYATPNAAAAQAALARYRVWSRIFPYSDRWLRLGLPPSDGWDQLEAAFRDRQALQASRPETSSASSR
ncbi:MAG: threonine-phosphate decarboxylase CobD [Pseudomonadota bacterium]